MKTIIFKDYYPFYAQDTFVDVPDELLAIFEESAKAEAAYERKNFAIKLTIPLTVAMELSMTSCLFLFYPMRFTNVSSQVSSSTLPLPLCQTSRQSESMHIILWA